MNMGSHLVPCPACQRHVRVSETACPFCAEALPEELRCSGPCQLPTTRLSRAALFAFRASLGTAAVVGAGSVAGAATVACSTSKDYGPTTPLYGSSPYDGGSGGFHAGGGSSGSGGVSGSGGGNGVSGAAGSNSVGGNGGSAGDNGNDGGPPINADAGQIDAGKSDAGPKDSGGVQPLYGAAPIPQ